MIKLSQAITGKEAYHIQSLWEKPEKITIITAKLIHNENRFYLEYFNSKNEIETDINTAFSITRPRKYK